MRAVLIVLTAFVSICSLPLSAQGITQPQADAILQELRSMRAAIERLATAPANRAPSPPPNNEPVTLPSLGSYALGSPTAPVTIVEFTDLQCPFCNRFATTVFDDLKKQYIDTGKVRFVTRDLPLPMHQHAMRAAKAARCAGEQGKFWETRLALVKNAATLSPELMSDTAKSLNLNMAAFDACLAGTKYDAAIQEDMSAAKSIGITGTPIFIVGKTAEGSITGMKLVGAQPLPAFEARIRPLINGQTP